MRRVLVLSAIAAGAIVAGVASLTLRGGSEARTPKGPAAPPPPPLLAVNDALPPAWRRALEEGSGRRSDAARPLQARDFGHLQLDNLGTRGAEAVFVVYRTRAGRSCFDVQFVAGDGSGLRPLRCRGATRCRDLCLVVVTGTASGRHHTILAGTVAREVRSVAVKFADGAEAKYDVFGTPISSIAGERVFMLDVTDRRVAAVEPA
jgi:hypothetical protein